MFTIEQIKEAHGKVKSGADFPAYVQDLKKLGVKAYDNFVADGHTIYYGDGNYEISSTTKYEPMDIAKEGSAERLKHYLFVHQKGDTDYFTFCSQAAEAGVEKWRVEVDFLTCTYYDRAGHQLLVEEIPVP